MEEFEQFLLVLEELVADQTGWVSQLLICADSIAAIQLMRGDGAAAINTMQEAINDGWTGHRGILCAPLWRDFYATEAEFRRLMDELGSRIDSIKQEIQRIDQGDLTASL